MKTTVQSPWLNPAFKRFQYLPHLPKSGSSNRACAAPRATAPLGARPAPEASPIRSTASLAALSTPSPSALAQPVFLTHSFSG